MKYACLIYQDEALIGAVSDEELDGRMIECGVWVGDLEKHGNHVSSSALQSVRTAITLRVRDGELLMTDGPFAETKEVLAGITIFEARDFNDALLVASKFPATRLGSVELRPILDSGVLATDPLDLKIVASFARTQHG